MPGNLNVRWNHGSRDCRTPEPPIQVHQFDQDTFILRQSKCSEPGAPGQLGPSFEAPFLYLLFGRTQALLLDTGASHSAARFPLASTVANLVTARGRPEPRLVVAHSHSHGDHVAGDAQFQGSANTVVVPPGVSNVIAFFGLAGWPDTSATFDLGGRILDVIPCPGHEPSHITLYDRGAGLLLTGDTLYPGLLTVSDWPAYVQSVARLDAFVASHPVSFVLGGHIEMTDQPGRWFGLGTLFQPGEHVLQLEARHVRELHAGVRQMAHAPRTDRHADFIIQPVDQPLPPLAP
jgi:hydroxyacylglutathione hydrolase